MVTAIAADETSDPYAHCFNGIQDSDEEGMDCGGMYCMPCDPAAHCFNGIQDSDETGVDCGGMYCTFCMDHCINAFQDSDEEGIDCGGIDCMPCATCYDGMMNGDETGVDCGGINCQPCVTCYDGMMNGDESGVDCGGINCQPCVTCYDGMMNGDETGVDCGGINCQPCVPVGLNVDFEGDITGWSTTGMWHMVDGAAEPANPYALSYSPDRSMWYGQDVTGDYDNGNANSGELVSPLFIVPANGELNFWSWEQTEDDGPGGYDNREVFISTDDGNSWTSLGSLDSNASSWYRVPFDLSLYSGQAVRLKFLFDTGDGYVNEYRGWYVDDVKVYEAHCNNTVLDGDEEDVDCGGADCIPCQMVHCYNGVQDADELDVDCGGLDCALCPDDDADGVPDVIDNCMYDYNPGQEDMDSDGIGDVCDDSDSDGVLDSIDNCPAVVNPVQEDMDADGIGNACDDSDADTVMDDIDNCPLTPNAGQEDYNSNGIGDVCDVHCTDGVMNADETGIDCGGVDCGLCPVVLNSLTPSPLSYNVTSGSSVTWTAVAAGGDGVNYEYEYSLWGPLTGNVWQVVRPYSGTASWTWNTGAADVGWSRVKVRVRRTGTTAYSELWSANNTVVNYPAVTADTLTPEPNVYTLTANTSQTWTATASGGDGVNYEYEYSLWGPLTGNIWQVVRPYNGTASWTWNTGAADVGWSRVKVRVRRTGTTAYSELLSANNTVVNYPAVTAVSLTPSPLSYNLTNGIPVTWTAVAAGGDGVNYEYEYSLWGPSTGNVWQVVRPYSGTASWTWNTGAADVGWSRVKVRVRRTGTTAYSELLSANNTVVNYPAVTAVSLTPSPLSYNLTNGIPVTWTAVAAGGDGVNYEYEYSLWGPSTGNVWQVVRPYSGTASWTWNTGAADVGWSRVKVRVRRTGTTAYSELWSANNTKVN